MSPMLKGILVCHRQMLNEWRAMRCQQVLKQATSLREVPVPQLFFVVQRSTWV